MKLKDADLIANRLVAAMRPHCERIQVAGSIRRQKTEVKDIELVVIPRWALRPPAGTLFAADAEQAVPANLLFDWGQSAGIEWTQGFKPEGKWWKGTLPEGISLDLFLVTPETWGNQLLIRTGCAEYSKALMTYARFGMGFPFEDGHVLGRDRRQLPMPDEQAVYARLGLAYLEPERRDLAAAAWLMDRVKARRAA